MQLTDAGALDLTGAVNQASGTDRTLTVAAVAGSDLEIGGTASAAAISTSSANQTLEIGATGALGPERTSHS